VAATWVATSTASISPLEALKLSWASRRKLFEPAPGVPWPDHISTTAPAAHAQTHAVSIVGICATPAYSGGWIGADRSGWPGSVIEC
jgi:hypothetical protein